MFYDVPMWGQIAIHDVIWVARHDIIWDAFDSIVRDVGFLVSCE
jgi:hypothetical protein